MPPKGPARKMSAQEFARLVNQGALGARDRFGRQIRPGDLVVWSPPMPLAFEVIDILPVLDPRAGPNLVTIQMRLPGKTPLSAAINQPIPSLTIEGKVIRHPDGSAELFLGTLQVNENTLMDESEKMAQQLASAAAEGKGVGENGSEPEAPAGPRPVDTPHDDHPADHEIHRFEGEGGPAPKDDEPPEGSQR